MINCLVYALQFWNINKQYKIVYNSDHAINIPKNSEATGFLGLEYFGLNYFTNAFREILTTDDLILLNDYFIYLNGNKMEKLIEIKNGKELELFKEALDIFNIENIMSYTDEYMNDEVVNTGYALFNENSRSYILTKTVKDNEEVISLAEFILETYKYNFVLDLNRRQNFISADHQFAIDSYRNLFRVGDMVMHESQGDETAMITGFEIDIKSNEITAFTTKGTAHLDFIYHVK